MIEAFEGRRPMCTSWRLLPALLLALSLAVPAAAREAPRDTELGRVVAGEHGTYYFPKDARGSEPWPVLIVEKGLADDQGKLWPLLARRLKLIVVETASQRAVDNARDGGRQLARLVDAALQEAANYHWRLVMCPWIPVGFSAMGPSTAQLVLENPGRFQGLLLLNSAARPVDLPADLGAFAKLPVGILHCRGDSSSPEKQAVAVRARFEEAGLDVHFSLLEGDHMAPVREAGAAHLAAFLHPYERYQKTEVLDPRWFASADGRGRRTLATKGAGGLTITADLYETGKPDDPVVLLFHQARSGRGEYRLVAPRLVKAGFNCLALDQRVGLGWGGVRNETAAGYGGKKALEYQDARPDLERAVAWVRELGFTGRLAVVGSSYSAALVVMLAAGEPAVTSVVSFSPGDYVKPKGSVFDAAKRVSVPALVICPGKEEAQARKVFEALGSDQKDLLVLPRGVHGASTLYRSPQAEDAWKALLRFLQGTLH